jgi:hypothetical protein
MADAEKGGNCLKFFAQMKRMVLGKRALAALLPLAGFSENKIRA